MSQVEPNEPTRPSALTLAVLFAMALAWSIGLRVPLVMNASAHLDSDLAVDGLVLAEAVRGEFRWHYPGTPHSGIVPVFLSLPQALISGANAHTLVSGGVVAYGLLVVGVFALAAVAFSRWAALWTLAPVALGSTGLVWLSGRITGGHLLAAAWFSFSLIWLYVAVKRPSVRAAALLGFWCGVGCYIDRMFLVAVVASAISALVGWARQTGSVRLIVLASSALIGFALGAAPAEIGKRVDPYDAYPGQFEPAFSPGLISSHFEVLATQCFPRLVSGHRLPDGLTLPSLGEVQGVSLLRTLPRATNADAAIAWIGVLSALAGLVAVFASLDWIHDKPARGAVRLAMLLASLGSVFAFVVNKNIFGSDNYRYLVMLVVPWFLGFGLLLDKLAGNGVRGKALALVLLAVSIASSTVDAYRWNLRLGWISDSGVPVVKRVEDPVLEWIKAHPEIRVVKGGYWDVYRLAFLAGGSVLAVPTGNYPDRFPENKSTALDASKLAWVIHGAPPGGFGASSESHGRRRIQFQAPCYLYVEGK